jgi:hypothetical protein
MVCADKTSNRIARAGRASTASRLGMAGTNVSCGASRQTL